MTRQRKWQLARIALGKCAQCGRRKLATKNYCRPCQNRMNTFSAEWRAKHREKHVDNPLVLS